MLRDRLRARLAEMGANPDHQQLAAEVLGIRGASPEIAVRLVAQALVVGDRHETWRSAGERIAAAAPATPGVYVLRNEAGEPLYVGKAVNLRRRLRAHFADRRWRQLKPEMSRVSDAEWTEVGSELEALLREAELIGTLRPVVNVQVGPPDVERRAIPSALLRDVIVVVPSIEADSAELVGAQADGRSMIQRTRRNGADAAVHAGRLWKFFHARARRAPVAPLAPVVFSWLSGRGRNSTRIDPHDARSARDLAALLKRLLGDASLFADRLVLYS